jgi:succinate dehydrogenase/fumarate reductase cytochrome b subunit
MASSEASSGPAPATPADDDQPQGQRRERRLLFELTGVVPLAVYVVVHVGSYATVLFGRERFGGPQPGSLIQLTLELLLVWLPLGFHGGYGLALSVRRVAGDVEERRTTLILRGTGVLAFAFIALHALWLRLPLWRGERRPDDALQMLAAGLSSTQNGVPLIAALHVLGSLALAAHLGYGLERFLVDYGVLEPRRARFTSFLLATALCLVATATIVELATGAALPSFLR